MAVCRVITGSVRYLLAVAALLLPAKFPRNKDSKDCMANRDGVRHEY